MKAGRDFKKDTGLIRFTIMWTYGWDKLPEEPEEIFEEELKLLKKSHKKGR